MNTPAEFQGSDLPMQHESLRCAFCGSAEVTGSVEGPGPAALFINGEEDASTGYPACTLCTLGFGLQVEEADDDDDGDAAKVAARE